LGIRSPEDSHKRESKDECPRQDTGWLKYDGTRAGEENSRYYRMPDT